MKPFLICCFLLANLIITAQVPNTDIYLLEMKVVDGKYEFSNPKKITDNPGYDNQPFFVEGKNEILFVSKIGDQKSDVYSYDIKSGQTKQITHTPEEDEYSPMLMPDGKHISVVKVEKDSTQRLWKINVKNKKQSLIFPGVKGVGYYTWYAENKVAMFVLSDPITLQLAEEGKDFITIADTNPGRCLVPRAWTYYYTDKSDSANWVITEGLKKKPVTNTIPGSEDYTLLTDASIFMGKEGKLYCFNYEKKMFWQEIADFTGTEYEKFYRIVASPDGKYLALVVYKGDKP